MESYDLCIATAKIHFSDLYWLKHKSYYAFDLEFKETSSHWFDNLTLINAGFDEDSAKDFLRAVKHYFASASIFDDSEVAVLFSGARVLAISARGNDYWIDVRESVFHNCAPKRFSTLDIIIKSLEVY